MEDDAQQKTAPMKRIMTWVGYATALIGLGGSLVGGIRWYENRRQQQAELAAQMAAADTEAKQGDYQASIRSYDSILKNNPLNPAALQAQLNTAMEWAEDFHVVGSDGQDAASAAGPQLDAIMVVLDAGLARSTGSDAADVQAHIGWAHWLNQHIAEREFGSAAEQNFQAALKTDPSNVYANAMLGNWMLQTNGNFAQAVAHLRAAAATGKARPFVHRLQLGGLIGDQQPGARAETARITDEMRKGGEPLDEDNKARILSYCCDPPYTEPQEITEFLSAVSQQDAWQTYLWLDDAPKEGPYLLVQQVKRGYIEANLLEIAGKRAEALAKFRALKQEMKNQSLSLEDLVDAAIKRLS
jgi:tetratricopeptide (TPR) repeat protein